MSIILYNFGFTEATFARENKEKQVFLWFSRRIFLPLASPKILSLGKTKKNLFSFGFPLAYSYLCRIKSDI